MLNAIETNTSILNAIGHYVEVEMSLKGNWGNILKQTMTGKIIYSEYNATLFFKLKGSRNKGHLIENETDIHNVKIIRKDKSDHDYYVNAYNNREQSEIKFNERLAEEEIKKKEQKLLSQEQGEIRLKMKQEKIQSEINEAKRLGDYDELENEVISFYQSFEEEFFNESFVKTTYIPILNKLIHKGINNINDYPKHYFDKKRNPKFCNLIENKLNIKLVNTQKGNVEKLNQYLIG